MTTLAENIRANGHSNGQTNNTGNAFNFDTFHNVVNGSLVDIKDHRTAINPATGETLWQVPVASIENLNAAVTASKTAFKTWSQYSVQDRKAAVLAYSEALENERAEFVRLLTTEQGNQYV